MDTKAGRVEVLGGTGKADFKNGELHVALEQPRSFLFLKVTDV